MVAIVHDIVRNSQFARRHARRAALFDLVASAAHTLARWRQRVQEHHELARMDWRELQDIGLTTADAQWLLDKPFWRD